MKTVEKIRVMQAWLDGKKIRYRRDGGEWLYTDNSCACPTWDWSTVVYEIAPREFWINVYNHGFKVHESKEAADAAGQYARRECIHVQAVVDDNS